MIDNVETIANGMIGTSMIPLVGRWHLSYHLQDAMYLLCIMPKARRIFFNRDRGIWKPDYRSRTDVFVTKPGNSVRETGGRHRNTLFQVSDQTA